MDTEYEYESSDDDDEIIAYQTVWSNISKRIHFLWPINISIYLLENDDVSILNVLIDTISKGVSSEQIAHMRSIEALENAILANPSKKKGYGRIRELKRLNNLIFNLPKPFMNISNITELHIQDATDFSEHHVLYMDHYCIHLKHITLKRNIPKNICDAFKSVEYAVLNAKEIPKLKGKFSENLKQLEIQNAHTLKDITLLIEPYTNINIIFNNVILQSWLARLLCDYIDLTISQVCTEQGKIIDYCDWRSNHTKRRKIFI